MKVYLLWAPDDIAGDGWYLVGVYSTRARARERGKQVDEYEIREVAVDPQ